MEPLGAVSLPQERKERCWIPQSCQQGALETLLGFAICIPGSERDSEPWGRLGVAGTLK